MMAFWKRNEVFLTDMEANSIVVLDLFVPGWEFEKENGYGFVWVIFFSIRND